MEKGLHSQGLLVGRGCSLCRCRLLPCPSSAGSIPKLLLLVVAVTPSSSSAPTVASPAPATAPAPTIPLLLVAVPVIARRGAGGERRLPASGTSTATGSPVGRTRATLARPAHAPRPSPRPRANVAGPVEPDGTSPCPTACMGCVGAGAAEGEGRPPSRRGRSCWGTAAAAAVKQPGATTATAATACSWAHGTAPATETSTSTAGSVAAPLSLLPLLLLGPSLLYRLLLWRRLGVPDAPVLQADLIHTEGPAIRVRPRLSGRQGRLIARQGGVQWVQRQGQVKRGHRVRLEAAGGRHGCGSSSSSGFLLPLCLLLARLIASALLARGSI